MLEVDRLTVRHGRTLALENVSFQVTAGEVVGLIGHNGAGKSTLFRVLAGLRPPTAGEVSFGGVRPDSREAGRLRGYMPDFLALPDWPTPLDLLRFYAKAGGVPAETVGAQAERTLAAVGLPREYWGRPLAEGSKGMLQRLSFATAIVHEPQFLLLDEPTGALDPEGHFVVQQMVRDLKKRGVTMLIASHILSDLAAVVDRVLVLQQGRVVLDRSWSELEGMGEPFGGVEALVATRYGWREKHA